MRPIKILSKLVLLISLAKIVTSLQREQAEICSLSYSSSSSSSNSRVSDYEHEEEVEDDFAITISPCPTFRSSRDKWGMGVRHSLFPGLALGATLAGAASFPTPFSTASGVFGLVAGPSSAFRPLNFE